MVGLRTLSNPYQRPKLTDPRQKDTGLTDPSHAINYYKYALIDPLDAPFATFRFFTRDWQTLEDMGIVPDSYGQDHESLIYRYSMSIGSCSEDTSVLSNDEGGDQVHNIAGTHDAGWEIDDSTSRSSDDEPGKVESTAA